MTETVRHLHLVGAASGQLRTAEYDGSEHLVVPVVAMVEGVVWAVNAPTPELVLASELSESPQQWNGRACFAGHPIENGTQVTANLPHVLETSFGWVFNVSTPERILATKRLELEAWLNPVKAAAVSPAAADVIRRLRAFAAGEGPPVEVSVGCYVHSEQTDGHYHGKEYHGIWRDIVSDHLAFLAAGEEGACSVAAGCGAPRSAVRHLITAAGIKQITPEEPITASQESRMPEPKTRGLKDRLSAFAKRAFSAGAGADGTTARELYDALDRAIRAIEPGYMWIEDVLLDKSMVVYCVAPEDEYQLFRRGYTSAADGTVTLTDTPEEVEQATSYQPVTAAAATSPAPALCGCGHVPSLTGVTNMKAAVKALIEGSAGKFTDADAPWLENVPDDKLALMAPVTAPVAEPAVAAAAPVTATAKPMTTAEWTAAAPPELKTLLDSAKAQQDARKATLVTALKTSQTEYPEAELLTMDVTTLERIARVAGVNDNLDFSGRGGPRVASSQSTELAAPPDPYAAHAAKHSTAVN